MLSPAMIDRLNKQINLEQYSSNLYLQMSAWCDNQGYTGSATFLREHAGEELTHMHKLFDYVSETGALAEDVEVGHGQVERSVGPAGDVRIADAFLLGEQRAVEDRLAPVDVGERIPVAADGKVRRLGLVFEVDQKVPGVVLFFQLARIRRLLERRHNHDAGRQRARCSHLRGRSACVARHGRIRC